MDIKWNVYINTIIIIGLLLVESAIIIPLSVSIHPGILMLYLLCMFDALVINYDDERIPDIFHMNRRCTYKLVAKIFDESYVYVKVWPNFWIRTRYTCGDLSDFIEKKVEYQHKQKETFEV